MAAGVVAVVLTLGSVVAFASPAGATPSWTIVASPNRKGSTYTKLSGVSCPSATFCVAVGSTTNRTLVEQWNGTHWSLVASPSGPFAGDSLAGVSCPSVTNCFAVGTQESTPLFGFGPLVEHWNGAHWSIMTGAAGGASHSMLAGVSCPSTNNCVAVGTGDGALIESWNGSGWSIVPSADPGDSSATLNGVSCPSANSCFAVGSWTPPHTGGAAPLTERWDGERWSVMDTPSDGLLGYTELTGVSCVTVGSCFAVGQSTSADGYSDSPVTERWDGERWSIIAAPVPQQTYSTFLNGVSCSSASNCLAVGSSGYVLTNSRSLNTMVEHWDGTRWSADFSANPSNATDTELAAVSCVSATSCFTVGKNATANGAGSTPVIERGPVAPPPGPSLNRPIVGMASTRSGSGHWLVASDGGIFTSGDAHFEGSAAAIKLNRPIVGMAATPSGHGYWLVASDGGIFTFGDAHFYGSTGALRLNKPIDGMAATPSGHGYWLVASDGGIFSFCDARFHGSTGAIKLNRPIVGMAATRSSGYWLVASDGGIFSFGDAHFEGSAAAMNEPIVGMAPDPSGHGYWLAASDGSVFSFGNTGFYGSTRATNQPIAGIAAGPGNGNHHYWLFGPDGNVFGF